MDWVYDVDRAARLANFIYYISPGEGRRRGDQGARPRGRREPAPLPAGRRRRQAASRSRPGTRTTEATVNELFADLSGRPDRGGTPTRSATRAPATGAGLVIPYLLMAPGLLWLVALLRRAEHPDVRHVALERARSGTGFELHLGRRQNYTDALTEFPTTVRQLARLRRPGDDPLLPHRLSARLRHRLPGRALQEPPAVPGHRPVLHELPHPDDLAGGSSSANDGPFLCARPRRPRASCPTTSASSARRSRSSSGLDLPVPAVHGPAAVRRRSRRSTGASSRRPRTCTPARGGAGGAIVGGARRGRALAAALLLGLGYAPLDGEGTGRSSPASSAVGAVGGAVGGAASSRSRSSG